MPTVRTAEQIADPDMLDAELHPEARLRFIQRRMQEDEGLRLTIDNIAYVLKFNQEYEQDHGFAAREPAA